MQILLFFLQAIIFYMQMVIKLFKLLIFSIFILKSILCIYFPVVFLSVFLHSTLFIDTDFKSDRKLIIADVDFP